MSPDKTKEILEQRLGKPINEVFAWIELDAPLGSASIAQVCMSALSQLSLLGCMELLPKQLPLSKKLPSYACFFPKQVLIFGVDN